MTTLVLGPLLRHVGTTTATVWVETAAACTVEVLGHRARTFQVGEQHFGLVSVRDLEPGTCRTYEVHLDGARVWPVEGTATPPSRIRTRAEPGDGVDRQRVVFGSCRYPPTDDPDLEASLGVDALDAYATRLMERVADDEHGAELPDVVCLLGDQVYADELTPRTQAWVAERRAAGIEGPADEIGDFAEYAHLYHETWTDRELRWLLSTAPVSMIFDDHDVRDDWNTSLTWREEMARRPWWPRRIRAGLASYWVYQHLGNLSPAQRETDTLYKAVTDHDGDAYDLIAEFAERADDEIGAPEGVRWSFRWDLGYTRLLVVDSRCGRVLNPQERSMINTPTFAWIEENATAGPAERIDHVLIGSSIPWLMPPVVSDVQSVDEVAASRGSSSRIGRLAEKVRQGVDLEHWPAFRASFDRLARLVERVASSSSAPSTVCVLSGDVHHSYVAEARFASPTRARVFQLTCSPVRNGVPWFMEYVFAIGWWPSAGRLTRRLARWSGLDEPPVSWSAVGGPWFGNAVATLELAGRSARLRVERTGGHGGLESVADVPLRGM